ncbi:hypothetical protein, partial [Flavonifractor plautii]|uniref:hypothetical protein n=1 Tax=Flavonifractor plautii TaxID=292800 RepID=UPI003D7E9841
TDYQKRNSIKGAVDGVYFYRASTELCKCFCLFPAFRIAHRLFLKDNAVPMEKGHDCVLEPQAVSKTASNISVLST